jgi:hypothetical protein
MALEAFKGDGGQSNIDFLFGVGIFLLTFIYAATFIPGLFVPYQPGAIDLSSVAYRTSAMLAEDPGWYHYQINGTLAGDSAWETAGTSSISRIGLAVDKDHPNVLSLDKINALSSLATSDYSIVRNDTGLNGTIPYNMSLALTMRDIFTGAPVPLATGTWPSRYSKNVEAIDRDVMIDTGKQLFMDYPDQDPDEGKSPIAYVDFSNVSPSTRDNGLRIAITNISTTDDTLSFMGIYATPTDLIDRPPLTPGPDYSLSKNGISIPTRTFNFTRNDLLEITIYNTTIEDPTLKYIIIKTDAAWFKEKIQYDNDTVVRQKSVYNPGTMRLEVWSDAFA